MISPHYERLITADVSARQVLSVLLFTALTLAGTLTILFGVLWLIGQGISTLPAHIAAERWRSAAPLMEDRLQAHLMERHNLDLNLQVPEERRATTTEEPTGPNGEKIRTVTNHLTYRLLPAGTGAVTVNYVVKFNYTVTVEDDRTRTERHVSDEYLDLNSIKLELEPEQLPIRPRE